MNSQWQVLSRSASLFLQLVEVQSLERRAHLLIKAEASLSLSLFASVSTVSCVNQSVSRSHWRRDFFLRPCDLLAAINRRSGRCITVLATAYDAPIGSGCNGEQVGQSERASERAAKLKVQVDFAPAQFAFALSKSIRNNNKLSTRSCDHSAAAPPRADDSLF